jgi:DAACS family dicarboxylate/amino acid:cation (Na+ or H+) symporter
LPDSSSGLAAGLFANAVGGSDAPWVSFLTTYVTGPIGQVFLRLLFMLVIPLLFSALVVGIAEMGDIDRSSGSGSRRLFFTIAVSGSPSSLRCSSPI